MVQDRNILKKICVVASSRKNRGIYIIELSENLPLICNSSKPVVWIFESFKTTNLHQVFTVVSKRKTWSLRNLDYFNSGRYYCHSITSNKQYYLGYFSVIVYGMKSISS